MTYNGYQGQSLFELVVWTRLAKPETDQGLTHHISNMSSPQTSQYALCGIVDHAWTCYIISVLCSYWSIQLEVAQTVVELVFLSSAAPDIQTREEQSNEGRR